MTCKICYGIASRDSFGINHCRACGADFLTPVITRARNKPLVAVVRAKGAMSVNVPMVRVKLPSAATVD